MKTRRVRKGLQSSDRRCPVCEARADEAAADASLLVCRRCGHAFAYERVETNAVFDSDDYVDWRLASSELRTLARKRVADFDHLGIPPGTALEIGCATGEAVSALQDAGWDAWGIDVSAAAVRAGNEVLGQQRLAVGVTPADAGFQDRYDLVVLFHVVEHLPDLESIGQTLRESVQPGGHIYIRLPNWASWSRRATGRHWPNLMPEHVHHFNPTSMQMWLAQHGFEVVQMRTAGRARDWLGAVRRVVRPTETATADGHNLVSSQRLELLRLVERLARPWTWLEERFDKGSELVVVARSAPSRRGSRRPLL